MKLQKEKGASRTLASLPKRPAVSQGDPESHLNLSRPAINGKLRRQPGIGRRLTALCTADRYGYNEIEGLMDSKREFSLLLLLLPFFLDFHKVHSVRRFVSGRGSMD